MLKADSSPPISGDRIVRIGEEYNGGHIGNQNLIKIIGRLQQIGTAHLDENTGQAS